MIRVLARRFGLALGTLLALSFLMYGVLNIAMDPLDDLRSSPSLNREALMEARIRQLGLDRPWWERWWQWLLDVFRGDFGEAWRSGQHVNDMLVGAIQTSVQLVFSATLIAVLVGVTVGLVSALRQYTAFDYTITFVAFVMYALPVFWFAVLLKQFGAIGVNDYLNNPVVNWPALLIVSVISGLFWAGALGGNTRRKLIVFGVAFAVTIGILAYALLSGWVENPRLGFVGVAVLGIAAAVGMTAVFAGMQNKRALYSALATAVVGVVLYMPMQYFFYYVPMSDLLALGLLVVAIIVGAAVGWAFGGPDRGVSIRGAVVVAIVQAAAIFADRVLQGWQLYVNASVIGGRPIATIGSQTPNLGGDYWITQLDKATHLVLPTIALVVISFATYTRYQRGAMLEVLNQDYIRTARAKGLPERVVIVRHALRNALMPLASVVPIDIITMIGGAVLTETIFSWAGMGRMFVNALMLSEIDPVMIYIMITGALAMIANLAADFLYAIIDPRIRVNA